MLSDRDRDVLTQLEHQLEQDDPAWAHQFTDLRAPPPRERDKRMVGVAAATVLLTALSVLFGMPAVALALGGAGLTLGFLCYCL